MTVATLSPQVEQDKVVNSIVFAPVPCLLSIEELSIKVDEQVSITWNGPNHV